MKKPQVNKNDKTSRPRPGGFIVSHAPLINILLSLLERQGCGAPLRGFALDTPKRSAMLLAGGMREKGIF